MNSKNSILKAKCTPIESISRSTCSACSFSDKASSCSSSEDSEDINLKYPGFPEISLKYLSQDTRPRNWCLTLITNPWFERISIIVILLNCITLGMYQPCVDDACITNRCIILQVSYKKNLYNQTTLKIITAYRCLMTLYLLSLHLK